MDTLKIALIDDHKLFRKGIEAILRSLDNITIVYESGSAPDFIEWLNEENEPPEVLLLDIEMPGMNGIELMQKIRTMNIKFRIIALSMHFRQSLVANLVESGVNGYLTKNCEEAELFNAIFSVKKTGFYFNEALLRIMHNTILNPEKKITDTSLGFGITPREKETLQLICREYTAAEIAQKLFLSVRTIEGYRNNLLQKSGAKNTAGLVLFAVRNHIVDPWF